MKLSILYLIDSIVQIIGSEYITLLNERITSVFCSSFWGANKEMRLQLFNLRESWSLIFSPIKLLELDTEVKKIDAGWPIFPPSSIKLRDSYKRNKMERDMAIQMCKIDLEIWLKCKHLEAISNRISAQGMNTTAPIVSTTKRSLQGIRNDFKENVEKSPIKKKLGTNVLLPLVDSSNILTPPPEMETEQMQDNSSFWINTKVFDRVSPISHIRVKQESLPFISGDDAVEIVSQDMTNVLPKQDSIDAQKTKNIESLQDINVVQLIEQEEVVIDLNSYIENPDKVNLVPAALIKSEPNRPGYETDVDSDDDDDDGASSLIIPQTNIAISAPLSIPLLDGNHILQKVQLYPINRIKLNLSPETLEANKLIAEKNRSKEETNRLGKNLDDNEKVQESGPSKEIVYELKESIKNVHFKTIATKRCGVENSGLCSIM